jgi:Leucine rich repeat
LIDDLTCVASGLQVVEADLFWENRELVTLEMQNNKIQMLSNHLLDGLEKLQIINFGENQIDEVQPQAFAGLRATNMINLSGNRLSKWENVEFSGTIDHLYLNNNRIDSIDLDGFQSSVSDLQLQANRIQSLQALRYNSKMTILNLADNQLTSVNGIRKFRQLEIVSLSSNPGLKLLPSTIVGLQSLKALFLKNAGLANLTGDEKWFADLPSLEELDLSYNNLEQLDVGAFASLQNLSKLNLDSTNITGIRSYGSILKTFPKLNGLMLLGNDFTCGYLDKMVDSLERPEIVFGQCRHLDEVLSTEMTTTEMTTTEVTTTEVTSTELEEVSLTMPSTVTLTMPSGETTLDVTVRGVTVDETAIDEVTVFDSTGATETITSNGKQALARSWLVIFNTFLSFFYILYNFQRK